MKRNEFYARIYAVVKGIPKGCVATYGQVASLVGISGHARLVGYALSALPHGTGVPWHRVINAKGRVSIRSEPGWDDYQRLLLEAEGVLFDADGRVSLTRFRWKPERPKPCRVSEEVRDLTPAGEGAT